MGYQRDAFNRPDVPEGAVPPGGVSLGTTAYAGDFRWDGLSVLKYKETGTNFKDITRQVLFPGSPDIPAELRYFEMGPGGHSTLERHQHEHFILIFRGAGEGLVEGKVTPLRAFDLVRIPPKSWHQFRATKGEPFGFLCLVHDKRDRPEHPTPEHLAEIRQNPDVAFFIRP